MAGVSTQGPWRGLGALAVSSGRGGGEVKRRDGLCHLPALALRLAVRAVAGRLLARARHVGGVRVRWVLNCFLPHGRVTGKLGRKGKKTVVVNASYHPIFKPH